MDSKDCVEELACDLTDRELLDYGAKLSGLHQHQNDVEARKKAAVNDFGAQLKKIAGEISLVSNNVRSKKETRTVECRLDYHWKDGKKILFRLDTGEIVRESIISDFERQQHMEFMKKERIVDAGPSEDETSHKYLCSSCGNEFSEPKEVNQEEDMPPAEVCPNCESPNWTEV